MSTGEDNGQGLSAQAEVVRVGGQLWRSPKEEMEANREIIAVHGRTYSIGYKNHFDALANFREQLTAWCYREDLIASAVQAMQESTGA